jgi:hypothetical protein
LKASIRLRRWNRLSESFVPSAARDPYCHNAASFLPI